MIQFDVVIVGAGPAGIGIAAMLKELGIERMIVLEREKIGATFEKWPKEMQLLTPSFTTNFFGHLDLNSVVAGTSPAYTLRKEHPTGKEYARYLREISEFFDLPIIEKVNVDKVFHSGGSFKVHITGGQTIEARFVIWAAGEFQYPNTSSIPGAELCLHNSRVKSWKQIKGDDIHIIGGYESGIDAAIHLSRLGKNVCVLDRDGRWNKQTTDPSENLSPFTLERLKQEMINKRIKLESRSMVRLIRSEQGKYFTYVRGRSAPYVSAAQPILATGFKSSLALIEELFHWKRDKGYCLLNEQDESTKTPGLFLAGPQVRHDDLIFCFIYKFRQRFGVVANAIGKRLGVDTTQLEAYRQEGLYLDDLSCCGEECVC